MFGELLLKTLDCPFLRDEPYNLLFINCIDCSRGIFEARTDYNYFCLLTFSYILLCSYSILVKFLPLSGLFLSYLSIYSFCLSYYSNLCYSLVNLSELFKLLVTIGFLASVILAFRLSILSYSCCYCC